MEPWQQRVIEEREDLNEKIEKLAAFFGGDVAGTLPVEDLLLMLRQHHYMVGYRSALDARIRRFKPE